MSQKTHTLVENPKLSANRMADYMAASEQGKRTIANTSKYRPTARVIQHNEAKAVVSNWLTEGKGDKNELSSSADFIRSKLTTTEFEEELNKHNADYVDAFRKSADNLKLPGDELRSVPRMAALEINGVSITFRPNFLITRINKRNVAKIGAAFLRYQKSKETPVAVREWQSALTFGYFRTMPVFEEYEPEKQLCVTVDAVTGGITPAPGKSVYMFNEIKAACAAIAERWPAMQAPVGAVF